MYGCVYFPADNTLSVLKDGNKNLKCLDFQKGRPCELKWKGGQTFDGTIVAVGDKEAELNKHAKKLLKEVLNVKDNDEDPDVLQKLLAVGLADPPATKPTKRKLLPRSDYEGMLERGTSLLDTWSVINQRERNFTPSSELLDILRCVTKPSIQQEIQEMLQHFEKQPEKTFTDLGVLSGLQEAMEESTSFCDVSPSTAAYHFTSSQGQSETNMPTQTLSQFVSAPPSNNQTPSLVEYQPFVPSNIQETSVSPNSSEQTAVPNIQAHQSTTCMLSQDIASSPPLCSTSYSTPDHHYQTSAFTPVTGPLQRQRTPRKHLPTDPMMTTPNIQRHQSTTCMLSQDIASSPPLCSTSYPTPDHQNQTTASATVTGPLRRSPRKHLPTDPLMTTPDETVTLMDDVVIRRSIMRASCQSAQKNNKPCFTLMAKLVTGVFTSLELANSRGLGIGSTNTVDTRPPLDAKKVKACKEYVIGWARGRGIESPTERTLNSAITEQVSYARKKLRRQNNSK